MKKVIVLLLAFVVIISCVFVSCKAKDEDTTTTTEAGLESSAEEFGFETADVTDKNGKKVTDKDGKAVTTPIAVKYKKDKKGKTYGQVLDNEGNDLTDKNGKNVTIKVTETTTAKENKTNNTKPGKEITNNKGLTTTATQKPTGTTKKNVEPTSNKDTTKPVGDDTVPKTNASGKEVSFSIEDQNIIKSMLEVPYLYTASYENSEGVPISIATHTAVWMAEREGGTRSVYPSSPIVLSLFKYYDQTVVNFKTKCNSENNGAPIEYIAKDDTFEITEYTPKQQEVTITKIEDLGKNNYYKVTGKVTNAKGKTKVVAIVKKNKLDITLGFSIKALKWS
ncbi:MAG: hypothetical protein NC213_06305 [Acetobacter sp.]|nr:hypothetical protein [Bacteroides sp.]MCM1341337.1 hypothetical protein [Acetobacter sp.]MCM1433429.1 hypothetical protein [Clostridiales bacterium]